MSTLNSRLQLAILNRKKNKNLAAKGYTLIELLITVVILGTLSAIALPNFLGVKEAADGKSAIASATALAKECSTAIVADLAAPTQTEPKGVTFTTACTTGTTGGAVYAAEAEAKAKAAEVQIASFQKKYALEKVFNAAGGRTDAADGVSFFDMFAEQLSGRFTLESDGTVVVVDGQGDPVLDSETGKRITPEEFISSFKIHPVYGTFFKGVKGSGAGLTYGGTDSNGQPVEDLSGMSNDELFMKAFGN